VAGYVMMVQSRWRGGGCTW